MIDLHTHSTASDGFLLPSELLEKAIKTGVEAIALTDHDTVAGVAEMQKTAKGKKIEVIAGAELSVYYPKAEMEILAIDIPKKYLPAFEEYQQKEFKRRESLAFRRVALLQEFGFDITYEDVAFDDLGRKRVQIRRPHFTDVLLKKGYIKNPDEAYQVVFNKNGIAYVENRSADAEDVIKFIRDNGAKAVLAHPIHTGFAVKDLFDVVEKLKKAGLSGIEVLHSSHTKANRIKYLNIIRELGLKTAGGSDFHGGTAHPENQLGTGKRKNLNIPYFVLEELGNKKSPTDTYYSELEKYI